MARPLPHFQFKIVAEANDIIKYSFIEQGCICTANLCFVCELRSSFSLPSWVKLTVCPKLLIPVSLDTLQLQI